MVARGQHPAAVLPEAHDGVHLGVGEAISDVDGHQPQLVVVESVEPAQDGVVAGDAVARGDVMAGDAQFVSQ